MGIWIRVQSKDLILKIHAIYVHGTDVCGTPAYGRDITLGTYGTKGQALMVLGDIQVEIVRQGLMQVEKEYRLSLPDIVFRMPEE